MQDRAFAPRTYRLAPEFRRSAWYASVGLPVCAAAACVLAVSVGRSLAGLIAVCTTFAAIALAMAYPLRWRMRIDESGVARRMLWWWDHWSWPDFESGRLRKVHFLGFIDPQRPWWRRKLSLDYLSEDDRCELSQWINRRYRLPAAPNVDRVEIRYRFRCRATLDAKGIHVRRKGEAAEYLWSDLRRVLITRSDPLRRDFQRLCMELPDLTIELQLVSGQGGAHPTWRGAAAEEVDQVIRRYAPSGVVAVEDRFARSMRTSDVGERLRQQETKYRELLSCSIVFAVAVLLLVLWAIFTGDVVKGLVLAAMFFVHPGSVLAFLVRQQHRRLRQSRQLASELSGETERAGESERTGDRDPKGGAAHAR